jgi:deoxyribodipyrimidine photolyase-related protein
MRNLILVLGDQLSLDNPALAGIDTRLDRVLMIEAAGEAAHVWSHRARIAIFLSAMRHFAAELRALGIAVDYVGLDDGGGGDSLRGRLAAALEAGRPQRLRVCEPGEYRVATDIAAACADAGVSLAVLPDSHFLCSRDEFADWAKGRKELRMEFFYREMRRRHKVLMQGSKPEGDRWNFDAENRAGFPKGGPGELPQPARFAPDDITREVIAVVERRFPGHPGALSHFAWPVTRTDALHALADFIRHRLPRFGLHQDAMWSDMPFGWHSLISAALNLKLLDPREVIAAAEHAWREGTVPLESAEGFIRQVLGWREFIRGVYWLDMPGLLEANHFRHQRPLPAFFWTGETPMNCMRESIGQSLRHGYAHHIQRLMVTGNFALLAELHPKAVHEWYLAIHVDAVEWAELPNTAGMALFANGGRFTSKPYIASGAYINRMSNYCAGCRYDPKQRTGPRACPFTTLYWNFLDRHEAELASQPRTLLMARNVARLDESERAAIREAARHILDTITAA